VDGGADLLWHVVGRVGANRAATGAPVPQLTAAGGSGSGWGAVFPGGRPGDWDSFDIGGCLLGDLAGGFGFEPDF
jgi:hypothetical protein